MKSITSFFVLVMMLLSIAVPLSSSPYDNLWIDKEMRKKIAPYSLPKNHRLQAPLGAIFSDPHVLDNEETFAKAGFITLCTQPMSYIVVARHPSLPNYLVKLYLHSEKRKKEGIAGWKWLVKRCKGAENIRKLIEKKKLKYFAVPDKWIYVLPPHSSSDPLDEPIILIVQDMNLVSEPETANQWKNGINKTHLDELFCILSHGYSSCYLINNIPYSKSGKFACIDTEHPKRKQKYHRVTPYLSPPMQAYWQTLID